jgi:predicted alpha/beta-hydrolase family hydrolase
MLACMVEITPFERSGVRGFLHRPRVSGEAGLALTHGAGGNCNSPLIAKTAASFCAAGLWVLRFDLAFRRQRPRGPPSRSSPAADRALIRQTLAELRGIAPGPLFLGGHSYGGRQASLLAAEDPGPATALLLLSYPLHPPGRPEQPRTEHFPRLQLPTVFVHGTRDPFGAIDELRAAASMIAGAVEVIVIDGAGHDLRRGDFDGAPAVKALLGKATRRDKAQPMKLLGSCA